MWWGVFVVILGFWFEFMILVLGLCGVGGLAGLEFAVVGVI